MRCLLDTHSFLWALFDPEKLSESAGKTIRDPENDILVSVVTFWEISLKYALKKLSLVECGPEDLPEAAQAMGLDILQIDPHDAASFRQLPGLVHKDPFDRLLIWQAIQNQMALVSRDPSFKEYRKFGLKVHW